MEEQVPARAHFLIYFAHHILPDLADVGSGESAFPDLLRSPRPQAVVGPSFRRERIS